MRLFAPPPPLLPPSPTVSDSFTFFSLPSGKICDRGSIKYFLYFLAASDYKVTEGRIIPLMARRHFTKSQIYWKLKTDKKCKPHFALTSEANSVLRDRVRILRLSEYNHDRGGIRAHCGQQTRLGAVPGRETRARWTRSFSA